MPAIEKFCEFYQNLHHQDVTNLGSIYAENVTFIDPVAEHQGLSNVSQYFAGLLRDTQRCEFEITQIQNVEQKSAVINWVMTFSHQKLNGGRPINVSGTSLLNVHENKIVFQRDYYDMGEMIYEHIPFLGALIRYIKRRLVL